MKHLFTLILLVFCIHYPNLIAQEINIKEGVYRNMVDFQSNNPFIEDVELKFKQSSKKKPIFKVSDKKNKINNQVFDFGAWAIYYDSCLYINLKRLGMGIGYSKIFELGRHSFFIGRMTVYGDQKAQLGRNAFNFGLIGAAVSIYNITKENGGKDLYLIDLKKGVPKNLTVDYMQFILRDDKDLYNRYMMEPEKASLYVMIEYVKALNSKLPIY